MSPVPFVDVRNITSASSPRFKKSVDALVKQSKHAVKTGKTTLNKEIKIYEQFINREKNVGKPVYVKLFTEVKRLLSDKPNSLKKKSPKST
jgi:excinuclease UvrABC ATPase subunit